MKAPTTHAAALCRIAVAWAATAALAWAQTAPAPAASAPADPEPGPAPAWVPHDQPLGSGRFPAVMLADPGLPTHTLYRPRELAVLGSEKLPLVVWGNGACVNTGNRYRQFLSEIASHGFLAIAIGPIRGPEAESLRSGSAVRGDPAAGSVAAVMVAGGRLPAPTPEVRVTPPYTMANQLADAIDWAVAENARAGSPLVGRIDINRVAVMGHSCGGVQAIDAARDPRVTAYGVWNSGLFPDDARSWSVAGARVGKRDLPLIRKPAIYISGQSTDVAFRNADDDYARIEGAPVVRAWLAGSGHGGTYREALGGSYGQVAVAWLRWQLKGDAKAGAEFTGATCGLCAKPGWNVRRKGLD